MAVREVLSSSGPGVYPHSRISETPKHSPVRKIAPTLKAERKFSQTIFRGRRAETFSFLSPSATMNSSSRSARLAARSIGTMQA